MMKMFLSMMIINLSIIMYFLNNPLSMGLLILCQTMLTCFMSSIIMPSYWYSYILFLTFLGGLLVLFIYVSSIASNELFISSFNLNVMFMLSLFLLIILTISNKYTLKFNYFNNMEMKNFFNKILFFNAENNINMMKLYNNQTFMLMMMMIIYLFITLIAIIKITNIFFGPLRSTFNY